MHIFIDEAGTFVYTPQVNAWSTVGALVVPDEHLAEAEQALNRFKGENGFDAGDEVKLKSVKDELSYFKLLNALASANCTFYGLAMDAHTNTPEAVSEHQQVSANLLLKHIDKMRFQSGRDSIQLAFDQVSRLPTQLYIQFISQVQLMNDVLSHSINYYAQSSPTELASFTWRIDRKEPTKKVEYEEVFEKLSPGYLQSISLASPMIMIEGVDYGHLSRYEFAPGTEPTYLRDEYNIHIEEAGLDVQKIFRGDIAFVDSKETRGIQLADLLSAGLRRCLRGEFKDNLRAAAFLGRLMVQHMGKKPPVLLLTLGKEKHLEESTRRMIAMMHRQQRSFLLRPKE